jgi:hypothetical protein
MKYLHLLTFVLLPLVSANFASAEAVNANLGLAKSNLWQAPYKNQLNLKAQANTAGLEKECLNYKKEIFAKDGSLNFSSAQKVDLIRQLPDEDSMDETFSAVFVLDEAGVVETNSELPQMARSKFNLYNQNASESELDLSSLESFKVIAKAPSLTAASASVGLSPLPIQVISYKGRSALKVQGKDTVCDFLDKKVQIQSQGQGRVRLPISTQISLNQVYSAIESQVANVLVKNESATVKTLRLGFRLSSVIAPREVSYSKDTEDSTLALFSLLFNENSLELSKAWGRFDGKATLSVSGSFVRAPMSITISN